jgi:hypothetical protein
MPTRSEQCRPPLILNTVKPESGFIVVHAVADYNSPDRAIGPNPRVERYLAKGDSPCDENPQVTVVLPINEGTIDAHIEGGEMRLTICASALRALPCAIQAVTELAQRAGLIPPPAEGS